jgi:hypothetical protein
MLSDEEKMVLASFVHEKSFTPGLILTDSDLWEIAMNGFLLKYQDSRPATPMFHCSVGFSGGISYLARVVFPARVSPLLARFS